MSGRKRVRTSMRLIAKEDAIDRVPCGGKWFCIPDVHDRPDFSATAHCTASHRKRQRDWDIFNAFVRHLNAVVEKYQISRFRHDATSPPPGTTHSITSSNEQNREPEGSPKAAE